MLRTEGVVANANARREKNTKSRCFYLEVTDDILSVIRDVAGAGVVLPG